MAAIVTKDHDYAGVMTAALINKHFPELTTKVYSSIVLNNVVGGLNPYAVEHTAAMGGKIVWLPTLTAENHFQWEAKSGRAHPASTEKIRRATPIPVLDANRKVLDAVKEILDVVATHPGGAVIKFQVRARVDTGVEVEYLRHGGILPMVLRRLAAS